MSDETVQQRLAAIRARVAKATKAPWSLEIDEYTDADDGGVIAIPEIHRCLHHGPRSHTRHEQWEACGRLPTWQPPDILARWGVRYSPYVHLDWDAPVREKEEPNGLVHRRRSTGA